MKTHISKYLIFTLFIIFSIHSYAQFGGGFNYEIVGDATPNVNHTETYQLLGSNFPNNGTWSLNGGGTIQSQSIFNATILWTSSGNFTITHTSDQGFLGTIQKTFTVQVTQNTTVPNTPTTGQVSPLQDFTACESVYLIYYTDEVPQDVTFYWQTTPDGTSTNNSQSHITVTTGSVIYLRARHDISFLWSPPQTVTYTFPNTPIDWYPDLDGDGFGDPNGTPISSCDQPQDDYVSNNNDDCPDVHGNFFNRGCPGGTSGGALSFVYTMTPQIAMDENEVDDLQNTSDALETVTYFDGIGRQVQTVNIKGSPNEKDIVSYIKYDDAGRQYRDYLPLEFENDTTSTNNSNTNGDAFDSTISLSGFSIPTGNINSYYKNTYPDDFQNVHVDSINPYSEIRYENSPLNRPIKQAAPGNIWRMDMGREIEYDYQSNGLNEVRFFDVNFPSGNPLNPQLINNGFYAEGELYKTITRDENHSNIYSDDGTFVDDQIGQEDSSSDDGSNNNGGPTDNDTPIDGGGGGILIDNTGGSGSNSRPITIVKNHTTEEFKDKEDRVILKRTYNDSIAHDTYYVYDILGNLTFVIPPKVDTSNGVSSTELSELCYQYKYDYRNRLVEKKIPGKGWEYIVYNTLNQPIMTQDANLRAQNRWLFTKYDAFGRVAYTGMVSTASSRSILQSAANNANTQYETRGSALTLGGTQFFYSNTAFPTNATQIYTINYYDDYNFNTGGLSVPNTIYGVHTITNAKGLATGSKIRILDTNDWITTLTGYDVKGRAIYSISVNEYLNTTDIVENKLDFAGKVEETKSTHTKTGNTPIVILDQFFYDHATRLVKQTQQVNNGSTEVIVENTYDEIGQLVDKGVGGNTTQNRLQNVDYTYNVRGWLKTINDVNNLGTDLFSFKINYNDADYSSSNPLYNGNISETLWYTANDASQGSTLGRGYSYTYDDLNRITSGTYLQKSTLTQQLNHAFGTNSLYSVTYDKNGNILSLGRGARVAYNSMDNLVYDYSTQSNKLLKVTDNTTTIYKDDGFRDGTNTGNDYAYDANGNMTEDRNKGMFGIGYNHLNLPTHISTISNPSGSGFISYIYDATGVKQRKQVTNFNGYVTTTTDYAGSFVYENSSLKFFNHPEGYVEPDGSGWKYVYQYKDHLGNVRLSYADENGNGSVNSSEIREENNYYPFGLKHRGYNNQTSAFNNGVASRWKFGGKEYNEELGLDWYDIQARNYQPDLGRWMNLDPLAELMTRHSPYNYAFNNPVVFTDPDGMAPETELFGEDGKKLGEDSGGKDGNVSIISKEDTKEFKKGDITIDEAIARGQHTTRTELKEANNVLNRVIDNGGLSEESSVVDEKGNVTKGKRGPKFDPNSENNIAEADLPEVPGNNNTSIHGHLTSKETSSSALEPGPKDPSAFKKFKRNIIVGRLGKTTKTTIKQLVGPDKVNINQPKTGAVFFDRNAKQTFKITTKAINKILKQ